MNKKGTALLTAMLVMGVLIAISLALSSLVIREMRVTKELLDAGKAYYSAESGIEEALYYLNNKLPGWSVDGKGDFGDGTNFSYTIKNTCNSYPCLEAPEYDTASAPANAFYGTLELNESLLLPLFVVERDPTGGPDTIKSVRNFTVEFYAKFDPSADLRINPNDVSGWDILRWKVFGMVKKNNSYVTDSISDFTAFAKSNNQFANAENPSWFGTVRCSDKDQENGVRATNAISCHPYSAPIAGECSAETQARDFYGFGNDGEFGNQGCFSIDSFVKQHQAQPDGNPSGLNYLSLTNIMNPAMFKNKFADQTAIDDASKIYFRVETYDDKTVREVAEIVSDGYSGDSKQSIKVLKNRNSYMPVFNFSVYSTYHEDPSCYYTDNMPKGGTANDNPQCDDKP